MTAKKQGPLWRRIVRFPLRAWQVARRLSAIPFEEARPGPLSFIARQLVCVVLFLTTPLAFLVVALKNRFYASPIDRLESRVGELWRTEPHAALALLRQVHEQLQAVPENVPVDIPPYGRFRGGFHRIPVMLSLYNAEIALGHFEAA